MSSRIQFNQFTRTHLYFMSLIGYLVAYLFQLHCYFYERISWKKILYVFVIEQLLLLSNKIIQAKLKTSFLQKLKEHKKTYIGYALDSR